MATPLLSVIVPAHQAAKVLRLSLGALEASTLARADWELVVVDDASTDDTSFVAAEYADTVVRLGGKPHGPAYARNRGFESTRGDIIVFIDADVCVHTDTLARFVQLFETHPDIGAALGSYDANPPAKGFISEYRNLLHHYHHQRNPGDAETFWAGCGAVRASVFVDADMYDEWAYPRPQIEDIELGHRIRAAGHRIVLRPEIQCAHLKRWTLRTMIRTDLNDRGVPWARLLVAQGAMASSDSLNLKRMEKISTALAWLMLALLVYGGVAGSRTAVIAGLACLIPVIYANRPLYGFFERVRGFWFALRVVPVHVLYYLLNGIAAVFGWVLHHLVGGSGPDPAVEAVSELGLETWPPAPVKRKAR
jgi:cellulose synthase/poly-beta-1,6-N-acetylglucosamine synthase-like glycosyltransferase